MDYQQYIQIPQWKEAIFIRKLTIADVDALYEVCNSNPYYFACMKSDLCKTSLQDDLVAVPPGKTLDNKLFLGYFYRDRLVGFIDRIHGYPCFDCLYIGWFMLHKDFQGKGIAKYIIQETLRQAKDFRYARLGHVKGNEQAEHFWLQQGFQHTGEEIKMDAYTVQMMEKPLR